MDKSDPEEKLNGQPDKANSIVQGTYHAKDKTGLPIVCSLGLFSYEILEDGEDYLMLIKLIPEDMLKKTFLELVDYMVDKNSDDLNQIPYNEEEQNLAKTINYWLQEAAQNKKVAIDILAPNEADPTHPFGPYDPRAIVGDHLDEIMKVKTVKDNKEELPYNNIELIVRKSYGEGLGVGNYQNRTFQQPR